MAVRRADGDATTGGNGVVGTAKADLGDRQAATLGVAVVDQQAAGAVDRQCRIVGNDIVIVGDHRGVIRTVDRECEFGGVDTAFAVVDRVGEKLGCRIAIGEAIGGRLIRDIGIAAVSKKRQSTVGTDECRADAAGSAATGFGTGADRANA